MEFLQAILTVTTRTIDLAIQPLGTMPQIRDDDPWIVAQLATRVRDDLGFDDRAARMRPRLGLIAGFAEDPRRRSRFWAKQLRVTLTAAAYVLLQELQVRADRTSLVRAQVGRLRLVLLKIGVRVTRSVRRFVLHLPRAHPDPNAWQAIARSFGAVRA